MMLSPKIAERFSLREITPTALSHYARSKGWAKVGVYGEYSDIYAADGKPEIIVPHSDIIGDYELAVSDLIEIFSKVLYRDDILIYRDLAVADRDVIRVKALEADSDSLPFEIAHTMLARTRAMLVAAAYSLDDSRRVYSTRVQGKVANYLKKMRLGHTERGSFALIVLSPPIAPRSPYSALDHQYEMVQRDRRVTERLSESLLAARQATNRNDPYAFEDVVEYGVSANLCEAVAGLAQKVSAFDISFDWAITCPTDALSGPVPFWREEASILREAARNFRRPEPEYGKVIVGFINRLARNKGQGYGKVYLRSWVDGASRSVAADLDESDYERAAGTHTSDSEIALVGDLEEVGSQLYLRNAKIVASP